MSRFDYILDKVSKAPVSKEPFRHIYIPNLFSAEDFSEITNSPEVGIPPASSDEDLFSKLYASGYRIIEFPGCITDQGAYTAWHQTKGLSSEKVHTACEGFGMTLRLIAPKSDVLVLLATFTLTVMVDLTVAIEVGMVLAAFLFIKRMAEVTNISAVTREIEDEEMEVADPDSVDSRRLAKGIEVYEINGPFFFGAAETFKDTLARIAAKPKVLIIRMRHVLALDSTGMHALKDVVHRSRKDGTYVLLSDVHMQPLVALTGSAVLAEIGSDNLFTNLSDALERAQFLMASISAE